MKIYKLEMITNNPSSDKCGYFKTENEADKMENKWREIVADSPDYYGITNFDREEIELGLFD